MACIATRPHADVVRGLERIADLPTVADTSTDTRAADEHWERIAVVRLADGIERVPPSVCRLIGEEDFALDSIERFADHLEVVLR